MSWINTLWFPTKAVSRSRGTNYYILLRIVPRANACCLLQKNVSNRTLEFGFLTFIGHFEKNVSNGTLGPVLIERNSDQWKQCVCLGVEEKHLIHTFNIFFEMWKPTYYHHSTRFFPTGVPPTFKSNCSPSLLPPPQWLVQNALPPNCSPTLSPPPLPQMYLVQTQVRRLGKL